MKKDIYYHQRTDTYILFQYIDRQLGEDNLFYCCRIYYRNVCLKPRVHEKDSLVNHLTMCHSSLEAMSNHW